MPLELKITDNSTEFQTALPAAKRKGLEMCGMMAEGYAKMLCPVNTGNLRNSITHTATEEEAEIGTNNQYGGFVEMGTGKYVAGGSPPWVYTPDGGKTFYKTAGQPPRPFILPSVADHEAEYKNLIESALRG